MTYDAPTPRSTSSDGSNGDPTSLPPSGLTYGQAVDARNGQQQYGQGQHGQQQYDQQQYDQQQYNQDGYGQQPPYGQPRYGTDQFGQPPYGQNPYGQNQYGQPQFGQDQYGQNQFGPNQPPYVGSASWDYGNPADTPQYEGWRPAAPAGLFPLRPLSFGDIFNATFRLLRYSPGASFGGAFLIQFLGTLVGLITPALLIVFNLNRLTMGSVEDRDIFASSFVVWLAISMIPAGILTMASTALVQAIVAQVAAAAAVAKKVTLGQVFKNALRRCLPLIGYALITFGVWLVVMAVLVTPIVLMAIGASNDQFPLVGTILLSLLCFGALIAIGMFLSTKVMFAVSVIVLEKCGPITAIRRSWTLTNGIFWRTLGIYLLVSAVVSTATGVVSQIVGVLFGMIIGLIMPFGTGYIDDGMAVTLALVSAFLGALLGAIMSAITTVLIGGNAVIMYADARMRKEGLNVPLQDAIEDVAAGKEPAHDPWRAPATS